MLRTDADHTWSSIYSSNFFGGGHISSENLVPETTQAHTYTKLYYSPDCGS